MDQDFTSRGGFVAENAQAGVEQYRLDLDPTKSVAESIEALIAKASRAIADQQNAGIDVPMPTATPFLPKRWPSVSDTPSTRQGETVSHGTIRLYRH